jgi:hypothetical protein
MLKKVINEEAKNPSEWWRMVESSLEIGYIKKI